MDNIKNKIDISVVIPLLNESESLNELSQKLSDNLNLITDSWEVLFIDDGSTDNSFEIIKKINEDNSRFKCIRFRRNCGKSAALAIGFERAEGEYIITMDADLQDDPNEIKNLIHKLDEGYDLVSGWKKVRHDPFGKTFPSKIFNLMCSFATGIRLHDFNCGLKGYKKDAAKSLNVYGEMHRFLPALSYHDGFKVTEIPVQHFARKYGHSKFGAERMIKGFLDLITVTFLTRFLKRPMHFFGLLGIILLFLGLGIEIYLVVEWVLGNTFLSNRPLTLFGIALIIVGVQSISLGFLGEMMVKNSQTNDNIIIKEEL